MANRACQIAVIDCAGAKTSFVISPNLARCARSATRVRNCAPSLYSEQYPNIEVLASATSGITHPEILRSSVDL